MIGRPDDRHGELSVAVVVPRDELDTDALLDWLAQRVAPHKRFSEVVTVATLPRTPSGKLLRTALRARFGADPVRS